MMYDVVVAGAGPAGSAAAKKLAEAGLRVLLADRQVFPRNKSCSGMLIRRTLELIRREYGTDVTKAVCCAPAQRGMVLYPESGEPILFEQSGANIWRDRFDTWLAEHAQAAGAEFLDGTAVSLQAQTDDLVLITLAGETEKTIQARYLIDCTGAAGINCRAQEKIVTDQTFYHGQIDLDCSYFHAFLQPEFSGYDAWLNQKDGYLIAGVAGPDGQALDTYFEKFISYLEKTHGFLPDAAVRSERWVMPFVKPGCAVDYGAGRILHAGDAAGFLNPMGEGISCAMESGLAAAQAVIENADNPSEQVQQAYQALCAETWRYMQRQWRLTASFSKRFRAMQK